MPQPAPERYIWFDCRQIQVVNNGPDPKARPAHEKGEFAFGQDLFNSPSSFFFEMGHVEIAIRVGHIEEVVFDNALFAASGLAGADVHAPVDLSRICGNDLAVEFFRQADGQGRFP